MWVKKKANRPIGVSSGTEINIEVNMNDQWRKINISNNWSLEKLQSFICEQY